MNKDITVVLLLLGRLESQSTQLHKAIGQVEELKEHAEVIVAADGPRWDSIPLIQMLSIDMDIKYCRCERDGALPSKVMNMALQYVKTDYIQFALLNDPFFERFQKFCSGIESFRSEHMELKKEGIDQSPVFCINSTVKEYSESPFIQSLSYDRMQNSERCLGMGMLCIPTEFIRRLGGVDESPLLQEEIERWLALAVMKSMPSRQVGTEDVAYPSLYDYPLEHHLSRERELARRYAVYCHGVAAADRTSECCAVDFAKDLCDEDAEIYGQITGLKSREKTLYNTKYRILILGGAREYHHNQICFYNYIENLYGQGFATYNCAYEYEIPAIRADDYDLVIFTRSRSENALKMMKYCKENGIPSLYMIDDNWMSISKDYPEQGSIFVPGKPDYDNFVEALGLCKAVWLFNDVLKKDVLPYTNCVRKFEISVNPKQFIVDSHRERKDKDIWIGFSGSMRYEDTAFRALARYARRHSEVTIILIGTLSPEQEALFHNLKCKRIGFQSYAQYARTIAELQPDLLLAPLQNNRTSRSKCYNKYIESAIVGAVCIYSPIFPYTDIVKEGVNGFFVDEETEEGWYNKIEAVLSDIPALRIAQKNAMQETMEYHSVEAICGKFAAKIQEVIEKESLSDD